MELKNKTVLVIGLAKSGAELVKYLSAHAKKVIAYDKGTTKEQIEAQLGEFAHEERLELVLGVNPTGEESVDLAVISPGIPLDLDFVQRLRERGIPLIGEVELAYRMTKGRFVGITGTNGKTTTTSLTAEIFKLAGFDTRTVGNIGNPIISEIESATENTVFVAELSSFQLETIDRFRCEAATIINITPDHLNRHKTMANYVAAKLRIFENQTRDDFMIVNADDEISMRHSADRSGNKIFVSSSAGENLYPIVSIRDSEIIYFDGRIEQRIVELGNIFLRGKHNYENVMIASALAIAFGIAPEIIARAIKEFRGVAHRLEYVGQKDGVQFFNDSKGTNPDASIRAIEAIGKNIILIAGGMDKKSDFDEFAQMFPNSVKSAILLGETKEIIEASLRKAGFENYRKVMDMEEAVRQAFSDAKPGDTVLLSPACASWDMYSCFEERGEHFKRLVYELGVEDAK